MVADKFSGNLSFVACLSSAFIPPAMTARSLEEYKKGGAVIFYDATAPLKLLLTADQNRSFLRTIERGDCKIGEVRVNALMSPCIATLPSDSRRSTHSDPPLPQFGQIANWILLLFFFS